MEQVHPLRKGGIDKHVAIINVFTNASNLKEMKFSTFGVGKKAFDFIWLLITVDLFSSNVLQD